MDCQDYEDRKKEWEKRYKETWKKYCFLQNIAENIPNFIGCLIIIGLFFLLFKKTFFILIASFLALIGFIGQRIIFKKANKYFCPPPLIPPLSKTKPSFLMIVLEDCDKNAHFEGYPPDWDEIKSKCFLRDENKCRLCGSKKKLCVHHIKPISFGGSHSLRNLITLCYDCHKKQEYYQHQELIEENIKASKKYWVGEYKKKDGKIVSGHYRRVGRKGIFWRRVKRMRDR